jgi:hypothetical protein
MKVTELREKNILISGYDEMGVCSLTRYFTVFPAILIMNGF